MQLADKFTFISGGDKYLMTKIISADNMPWLWQLTDMETGITGSSYLFESIVGYLRAETWRDYKPVSDLWDKRVKRMVNG